MKNGFSLLELLAALTLVAIAAALVATLFPKAKRSHLEDREKVGATFIAERIINTLQTTLPEGMVGTAPDWITNRSHTIQLPLDQPSEHYFAYDSQGRPCRELSLTEYEAALHEESIRSLAKLSLLPQAPEMTQVSVIIATPADLPDKRRHHLEFTFLISTAHSSPLDEFSK
jgi:prepilin-type N-terminal cleavage/methylation domain-containing protein